MSLTKYYITLSLFLTVSLSYSQEPWNRTYSFGLIQANGYGLVEYNDRYFVMGQGLDDSDPRLERSTFFLSVDLEGNYVNDVLLDDGPNSISPTFNNLAREIVELNGSLYCLADDIGVSYIHKTDYNLDTLEIIHTYKDTLYALNTPRAVSCGKYPPEHIMAIAATNFFPTQDSIARVGRILVTLIDPSNADKVDKYHYHIDDRDIDPGAYVIDGDGNLIIIGGLRTGGGIFAVKIDQDMQMVDYRVHEGPWIDGGYTQAVIDEQGDITFVFNEYEERDFNILSKPILCRMNNELDLIWTKSVVQDSLRRDGNYFTDIVQNYEHDGFVICGIDQSDLSSEKSILSMINLEGDTLWYKTIKSLQNVPRDSELFSVIATSDGNYMAAGKNFTTTFHDSIGSWSQTWLVKFDGEGHIVEDGVSVAEPGFTDEIRLYPNPSSDYMYIEHDEISGVRYQLYDAVGRMVYATDDISAQSINMLDVSIYDSGIYYLHISVPGTDDYHVEKLVIE